MNGYDVQAAQLRKQEALVNLIGALASLVVMGWYLTPAHQRQELVMRVTERTRRVLERAARSAGRQRMGVELATGRREYSVPYLLSVARDRAAAAYERRSAR